MVVKSLPWTLNPHSIAQLEIDYRFREEPEWN